MSFNCHLKHLSSADYYSLSCCWACDNILIDDIGRVAAWNKDCMNNYMMQLESLYGWSVILVAYVALRNPCSVVVPL